MRTILLLALFGSAAQLGAQELQYSWNVNFDGDATRTMDSVQGCWQIGTPQKPVFTSAFSAPLALVTDTILPYPVQELSYANVSIPVYYYGEYVRLSFKHRMDADPGEAFGWIEYFDPVNVNEWVKVGSSFDWSNGIIQLDGGGQQTDTAWVFSGGDDAWMESQVIWVCIGVFQGDQNRDELLDSMRVRFAFKALANTNQRDGWMIDDLVLENYGMCSGIQENTATNILISPNPASDHMLLDFTVGSARSRRIEVLNMFGAIVLERTVRSEREWIDLANLPDGVYMVRTMGTFGSRMERFVVQR